MKKFLTGTIVTIALLGLSGAALVSAQTENLNLNYPPIIERLAEKFNLNLDELKTFFEENRPVGCQERMVGAGLTDEQREALQAKQEEMREKYGDLKDLSLEERQAKMQEMRQEMNTWMEENGIDFGGAKGFIGKFGKGFGPGFGLGHWELRTESSQE